MFLKEIHIQNFKGFDDLRFSFTQENGEPRKHTILLGENGTGKSNLLKAIALGLARPSELIEIFKNPAEWISLGKKNCKITTITSACTLVLEWNINDSVLDVVEKYKHNNHVFYEEHIKNKEDNGVVFPLYGYGAFRKFNYFNELGLEFNQRNKASARFANLFDADHSLYPITKWLIDLDYNSNDARTKEMFQFVQQKLNTCLNNISFYKIQKADRTLWFKEGDKELPLSSLSDGYQNMAAFIVDLLYKWSKTFTWNSTSNQDSFEHLFNKASKGLILIDELDLHLHPKWQRQLLAFFAEQLPHFQIIATTHSPLTAQQAGEGELFTLKKDAQGKVEILPFRGSADKMLVGDLLTSKDAFGLSSSESFKVENLKSRYLFLKERGERNAEEEQEWQNLKETLQAIPNDKGSAYYSQQHYQLLLEIKAELHK
ncbi:MAG: AAA family ATPase [Bacteroidia bacterium]